MADQLEKLTNRVAFLEGLLGRIMQIEMRLDTLEFNSGVPVNPSIAENFLKLKQKLEYLEFLLLNKEPVDD